MLIRELEKVQQLLLLLLLVETIMNRKTIWLIVGLMSVALIGLTSFQLYWINSAIDLNRERFQKDVHESIIVVGEKLTRNEFLYETSSFMIKEVHANQPISPTSRQTKVAVLRQIDDAGIKLRKSQDTIQIIYETGDTAHIRSWTSKFGNELLEEKIESGPGSFTFSSSVTADAQFARRMNVMMQDMFSTRMHFGSHIDPSILDSLLHQEFANRGITMDFDFGVFDSVNDTLLFSKSSNNGDLKKSELRASLFPQDIMGNAQFLMVNFPDESLFLFKQIWATLASSVVLLLVIIGCFAYAIYIIIRQKKISEIKNDFINNMTHEFKTPISTVSLACEALQEQEVSTNKNMLNRYIGIIKDENKRLGVQVEKVLQMATLDKKDFKLNLKPIDIHNVIERSIGNINLQIDKNGGLINSSLSAHKHEIVADEIHVANIVDNLLDNATKYSKGKPDIQVKTTSDEQGLIIKVIDKGIGMSREAVNKIFDKFYRVPTGNLHDVKGFGLGLSYVRSIVEAHGGTISVSSELNVGSSFEIFLPFKHD